MTNRSRAGPGEWLLLTAAVVIACAGCEIAVRAYLQGDEITWSMVPPAEVRVRNAGEKLPGSTRILVLGDSQTEWRDTTGHSYVRVAGRRLMETGVAVQMVNLAEASTGLESYFGNLITYAGQLNPDVVVVGLYLGNDLDLDSPPLDTPEGRIAALGSVERYAEKRSVLVRLAKRSVFLSYVYLRGKRFIRQVQPESFEQFLANLNDLANGDHVYVKKRLQEVDPAMVEAARAGVINRGLLEWGISFPDYFADLAAAGPNTQAGTAVHGALRDLAALVRFCRERQLPVAVVLVPPPVWISERYHDFFRRIGYRNLGPVMESVPLVEQVKQALTGLQVPVVDVLPALRAAHENTYIANDEHLNRRGHEIVGTELARVLVASGLLKQAAKRP